MCITIVSSFLKLFMGVVNEVERKREVVDKRHFRDHKFYNSEILNNVSMWMICGLCDCNFNVHKITLSLQAMYKLHSALLSGSNWI